MITLLVGVVAALAGGLIGFSWARPRASTPSAKPAPLPALDGAVDAVLPAEIIRSVMDSTPTALVVYRDAGTIAYANRGARELFFEGRPAEGTNLLALLGQAPEPLRAALLGGRDDLFTIEQDGERETYHLARSTLDLGGEPHTMIIVRHLTQELNRREIEIWKKLLRVISHELNNSLAPVSSLMHSARLMVSGAAEEPKLARVFETVSERIDHLKSFLEGYARFARLPAPRKDRVAWAAFLAGVRELYPDVRYGEPPAADASFDRGQMQQVIINLLKNAAEAGSPPGDIQLDVQASGDLVRIDVSDRGKGMTEDVMRNALLPFYSTKERGSGLGLALCQEIVEAHGGRLRIRSREGGGLVVSCVLPSGDRALANRARLTLTRG